MTYQTVHSYQVLNPQNFIGEVLKESISFPHSHSPFHCSYPHASISNNSRVQATSVLSDSICVCASEAEPTAPQWLGAITEMETYETLSQERGFGFSPYPTEVHSKTEFFQKNLQMWPCSWNSEKDLRNKHTYKHTDLYLYGQCPGRLHDRRKPEVWR